MRRFFATNWVPKQPNDQIVQKAKSMGYRSIAALKLIELNKRYNILSPGMRVIDLGAAPGGWSQVAAEIVQSTPEKRLVFSIDLQQFDPIPGCYNLYLDMGKTSSVDELLKIMDGPVDVVLSDMSGNYSTDRDVDCSMMGGLNLDALYVAKHTLKKGGTLLMKMLNGQDEPEHFKIVKEYFNELTRVKPSNSKSQSREIYYFGKGWTINQPKYERDDIEQSEIKDLIEKAIAAGVKSNFYIVDPDIESLIHQELGSINRNRPELEFLSDEARSLDALSDKYLGKYSFIQKVPETLKDVYKLKKDIEDGKVPRPVEPNRIEDLEELEEEQPNEAEKQKQKQKEKEINDKMNSDDDYEDSEMGKFEETFSNNMDLESLLTRESHRDVQNDEFLRKIPISDKSPVGKKSKDRYRTQDDPWKKAKKDSDLWDKDE